MKSEAANDVSPNKMIRKLFQIILVLGLISNIAMLVMVAVMYRYEYPRFHFKELGVTQIYVLSLPFLPALLALIGCWVVIKVKKHKVVSRILVVGMIPVILFGGFCTFVFLMIPPICSATDNPVHYMKTDGDLEKFAAVAKSFFPQQIPEYADNVDYQYERYSSFFEDNMNLEASWVLPEERYGEVKNQVLELKAFQNSTVSTNGESGIVTSDINPEQVTIAFEYDDAVKKVTYRAHCRQNY